MVLTIEQTPLGDFEMSWGVTDLHTRLSSLGIAYGADDANALPEAVWCRDPQHGESMPIHLYRDANDRVYALGEITNGIWVVGVSIKRT